MDTISYKTLHESFTSNNNGSTAGETVLVISPSFISAFLVTAVRALLQVGIGFKDSNLIKTFFIEFLCMVVPAVLSFTILSDHLWWVIGIMLLLCLLASCTTVVLCQAKSMTQKKTFHEYKKKFLSAKLESHRRSYITNVRAYTNLVTVLCIMAVDFFIFPRRFAKTETFGYGIMDIGVGMFVTVNALVAPETRYYTHEGAPMLKVLVKSVPLALLGAFRIFATRKMEYQEHVTEYGRDWNFFFTLVVTMVACSLILKVIKQSALYFMITSGVIILVYESVLNFGLRDWIFNYAYRDDFITANREGLASNIGYIALYFGGVSLGKILTKWDMRTGASNVSMIKKFMFLTLLFWTATVLCGNSLGVSRRLANFGYYLWVLSFTTTLIVFFLICESLALMMTVICDKHGNIAFVPVISEAINFNGLLYFLLGNILTGLINVSTQTLLIGPVGSFIVLLCYMFVNCAVVTVLYYYGLPVKI